MDLLIEQEVLKLLLVQLQLQLQLLFLMMNRLFTCKIKEHNEIIVQLAPLAPLWSKSKMIYSYTSYTTSYSHIYFTLAPSSPKWCKRSKRLYILLVGARVKYMCPTTTNNNNY